MVTRGATTVLMRLYVIRVNVDGRLYQVTQLNALLQITGMCICPKDNNPVFGREKEFYDCELVKSLVQRRVTG